MARTANGAVFFVGGELPRTTHRLAQMTFELCRSHVERGSIVFVNDLKSVDMALRGHDGHERTYLVSGAPCDYTLLGKLDYFGDNKAIVDVNLDDGLKKKHHRSASVLKLVSGVPILQLTDGVGGEDHNSRILWVLRGLRDLNRPPIPAAIIEKVLSNHRQLEVPVNALARV